MWKSSPRRRGTFRPFKTQASSQNLIHVPPFSHSHRWRFTYPLTLVSPVTPFKWNPLAKCTLGGFLILASSASDNRVRSDPESRHAMTGSSPQFPNWQLSTHNPTTLVKAWPLGSAHFFCATMTRSLSRVGEALSHATSTAAAEDRTCCLGASPSSFDAMYTVPSS